ncbi:MAG: indole-3-glycerol-phosphate synthase [Syntrophus sp. (in: bacteria)]|nr:indole-3-glycerol-phosphate synthase [Syntrophus sp. (in: bacteria)]
MPRDGNFDREKKEARCGGGGKPPLSASIRMRQRSGLFPVISEIKVRSDKEGDLLRGRDPVVLAQEMSQRPVAGISVVTETAHFGGHMGLLKEVAAAVGVPVLHKDFITTERQVQESAARGASAILLITAMLDLGQMARLIEAARECGLETLVEGHDAAEIRKIEHLPFDLRGINNRDITVFEVDDSDVSRTEELAGFCRGSRILISESSIRSAADVRRAGRSGADAVLVGTAVLKAEHVGSFLDELIAVGWPV